MSSPFEPPSSGGANSPSLTPLIVWTMLGALHGLAIGTTLHVVGVWEGAGPIFGVAGTATGLALGTIVLWMERRHALGRPAIVRADGGRSRPVHLLATVGPLVGSIPALMWLGVLLSVVLGNLGPAVLFGGAAFAAAFGANGAWFSQRFLGALESLELGDDAAAVATLEIIQGHPLAPKKDRIGALIALGGVAMQAGQLEASSRWYAKSIELRPYAQARIGLAVSRALTGHEDEAESLMRDALQDPGAVHIQAQADFLRLLLVCRSEGRAAALELGERLQGQSSGGLFLGLLASLHDGPNRDALIPGGLLGVVPEGLARAVPEFEPLL